jgi:hypothetical protein
VIGALYEGSLAGLTVTHLWTAATRRFADLVNG